MVLHGLSHELLGQKSNQHLLNWTFTGCWLFFNMEIGDSTESNHLFFFIQKKLEPFLK